jgi:hypothetical protein
VFGFAIPYTLYRLSRALGLPILVASAFALGLAYGSVKADHAWTGNGLQANVALMALSALALMAYVSASILAARALAKRR